MTPGSPPVLTAKEAHEVAHVREGREPEVVLSEVVAFILAPHRDRVPRVAGGLRDQVPRRAQMANLRSRVQSIAIHAELGDV